MRMSSPLVRHSLVRRRPTYYKAVRGALATLPRASEISAKRQNADESELRQAASEVVGQRARCCREGTRLSRAHIESLFDNAGTDEEDWRLRGSPTVVWRLQGHSFRA